MDVPVYNVQGDQVGTMPIDEAALGESINAPLIKQAYVRYHANLRQGSARSKSRSDITGSRRKLFKQKGTGRGRKGDNKPGSFRGGAHQKNRKKTREDYRLDMPVKMRRKANRNALLAKLVDDQVKVIDAMSFDSPKTSAFRAFLAAVNASENTLVAFGMDEQKHQNARLSCRNLDSVRTIRIDQLTCFEMLNHRQMVVERGDLEAWLDGPSGQTNKSAKTDPKGKGNGVRDPRKARPKRGPKARAASASATGGEA